MASQIITGSAPINVAFSQVDQTGYLGTVSPQVIIPIPMSLACNFSSSGIGANQGNQGTGIRLSLAAAPQTVDLTSLVDLIGDSFSLARVRLLAFRNNAKTDGWNATVNGSGSNLFTGFFGGNAIVYPGTMGNGIGANNDGFIVFGAPNTTGAPVSGSNKDLVVDPGSHTFTFDIVVIGCDT